jgi:hypothetical protein
MSKAIYFAGVSRLNGELKFRTAQSPARFQQLTKLGDTEVEMSSVNANSKEQAAQELLDRNFANGRAEIQALLESVAGKTSAPRKAREVKVKKSSLKTEPKKLSVEEANKLILSTMREIDEARALELLCHRVPKKRRSRKTQVEAA